MPRIPHSALLRAYKHSPLLPSVLRGSRSLQSAINELRWLREHVDACLPTKCRTAQRSKLLQLCKRRSRGEPLQYILGSQPFGELDIKCRPGVLIPRPETEAYTIYLAHLITSHRLDGVLNNKLKPGDDPFVPSKKSKATPLKILDLCTGSGCIPLLLNSLVPKTHPHVQIYAWDISPDAIALAKENRRRNARLGHLHKSVHSRIHFNVVDIFDRTAKLKGVLSNLTRYRMNHPKVDIIISNPPYISGKAFMNETTRSVRNWEPKLALVPRKIPKKEWPKGVDRSDLFYHRLLTLHSLTFKSWVLVMEVGDEEQAFRVAKMAMEHCGVTNYVEIWKDNPEADEVEQKAIGDHIIILRGAGMSRAVILFRFSHDPDFEQVSSKLRLRSLRMQDNTLPGIRKVGSEHAAPLRRLEGRPAWRKVRMLSPWQVLSFRENSPSPDK